MPIETQEAFQNYIVEVLRYNPAAARTIALSARFHDGRFRGGDQYVVTFLRELPRPQLEALLYEFGNPEIVYDHIYSPADDDCRPKDNDCCARYRRRQR
jgi:hypothetical protein